MLMCVLKLCGSVTFHQLGLVHTNLVGPYTRVPSPLFQADFSLWVGDLWWVGNPCAEHYILTPCDTVHPQVATLLGVLLSSQTLPTS